MSVTSAGNSFAELLAEAGLPAPEPSAVSIRGADPVVRTRYAVGQAGAATYAAVGHAAARLQALRTGRLQAVTVDVRHAAIALRGNRYIRIGGEFPGLDFRGRVTGFYPVRDGRWIYLHCNFPNLRAANLGVLGAPENPDAIAAATASWGGEALEEAIFEAGGCGGFARTDAEWRAHRQARAVVDLPLLTIEKIGDAPVEPLPGGARPLAGIRAIDMTRVIAGPSCARSLAEHGADVLKVMRRGLPDSGVLDLDSGIGKRSTYLDLREADEAGRLRDLIRGGDVFVQAYRPGTLARRGFGSEDLARLRPGIVHVTLSAWGHGTPWQDRRGYDTVVQSCNGMAMEQGGGAKPVHLPVSAIDYVAGNLMAFGALVALERRATIGGSWLVRVSLARAGLWIKDHGMIDAATASRAADDLPAEEIEGLCREFDLPNGLFRYLAPITGMSETPPFLASPPPEPGSSQPVWLPRGTDTSTR